jgi:curved DNA-binding protein
MNDPHSVLGLEPGASEKEIKSAFKKLAKKHHPDVGGDEKKFKEINEAYSILTGKQEQPQPDFGFGGGNPFGAFFDESIFNTIFRGGGNRVLTRVQVDPLMLLHGGSFEYQYQAYENRNGRLFPQRKTATIRVEADSPAGVQIVVPGTQPNHIIVQLIPGNTERFQVNEMFHLTEIHRINVWKAMCGGNFEITTPLGKHIALKIPPGTQSGSIHRLRMAGLKTPNGSRGDYNIQFVVDIPAFEGVTGVTSDELQEKLLESMKEGLK